MSTLVAKIAQKFGLNQADVQAVFDADRTDRMAQMEAKYEQQLTQYVTDGKITDAQKQLILAKHKELEASRKTNMQNIKSMTAAERKAAMSKEHDDLTNWAKQNNIDVKYLMPFGLGRGSGGKGHLQPTATPTASQ